MNNKFKISIFLLLTLSLVILCGIKTVIAKEGLLDGKVFIGQSKEKHKGAEKKDELRFLEGKFRSIDHVQSGFNEGVYTAIVKEDRVYFEAETVSPKQGKINWRGFVHGETIEVDYRWSKKGWFSDTVKDYSFNGKLMK